MFRKLFPPIHFDWKIVTITIVSTLVLMVDSYHHFTSRQEIDRAILYLVIPLLFTFLFFRESPREYGFTVGDWRAGLVITLGAIALMTPIIWNLGAGNESMRSYYDDANARSVWFILLEMFSWEFFFRGWILFGYARKFGPEAMWLQAVPFALAHIGKPEVETLSTIFGGFAFGWIAWRTKSFFYPFVIHFYIYILVLFVASGLFG